MSKNHQTTDSHTTSISRCPTNSIGLEFNPFQDPYLSDPYAFWKRARENENVFYSPKIEYWVITRYADIKAILIDPETFSSSNALSPLVPWPKEALQILEKGGYSPVPLLSNNNPPSHTRVRSLVNAAFTPEKAMASSRGIKWLEPHIYNIINQEIDKFINNGHADVVQQLFDEVHTRMMFVLLGIPDEETAEVNQLAKSRAELTWGKLPKEEIIQEAHTLVDYWQYCEKHVNRLVENPGDDYTSELIRARKGDNSIATVNEITMTVFNLLLAGSNPAGRGLINLLNHRESWKALCQDSSLIPNAVEEIFRYETPVITWRRITTKPVEIGRIHIPAEAPLLIVLGSANRDEKKFPDGETFDIYRKNAKQHLAFSFGIHYCLGAPLARLELKMLLKELTRRLPHMRLIEGQTYEYSSNIAHRGPEHVWVEWDIAKQLQ
jgi:hypothetical protein